MNRLQLESQYIMYILCRNINTNSSSSCSGCSIGGGIGIGVGDCIGGVVGNGRYVTSYLVLGCWRKTKTQQQ